MLKLETHVTLLIYFSEKNGKKFNFYNRDENCLQRGTDWVFK